MHIAINMRVNHSRDDVLSRILVCNTIGLSYEVRCCNFLVYIVIVFVIVSKSYIC